MDNQFTFEGSPMPPEPPKGKKHDGYAIASLVLGIVGLVLSCPCCCCLYPIAGVCGVLAIVFSVLSIKQNGKNGFAIAGLVLGIVALVIVIAVSVAIIATPDSEASDPMTQDELQMVYSFLEKYFGKEFADEWYQEITGMLPGAGAGEGLEPPEVTLE